MKTNSTKTKQPKTNQIPKRNIGGGILKVATPIVTLLLGAGVVSFGNFTLEHQADYDALNQKPTPLERLKDYYEAMKGDINSIKENIFNKSKEQKSTDVEKETMEHYKSQTVITTAKDIVDDKGNQSTVLNVDTTENSSNASIKEEKVVGIQDQDAKFNFAIKNILPNPPTNNLIATSTNKFYLGDNVATSESAVVISSDEKGELTATIESTSSMNDDPSTVDTSVTSITKDTDLNELHPTTESEEFKLMFAKKTLTQLSNNKLSGGQEDIALKTVSSALLANWSKLSASEQKTLASNDTKINIDYIEKKSTPLFGTDLTFQDGKLFITGLIGYKFVDKRDNRDVSLLSGKIAIDEEGNYAGSGIALSGRMGDNLVGTVSVNHNMVNGVTASVGLRYAPNNSASLQETPITFGVVEQKKNNNTPTPTPTPQPHSKDDEFIYNEPSFADGQRADNQDMGNSNSVVNNNNNVNSNTTNANTQNSNGNVTVDNFTFTFGGKQSNDNKGMGL